MRDKSKTVTRRIGWSGLKPGTELLAVSKCMGLKKGEKAEIFGVIKVKDVKRECLSDLRGGYGTGEARKEGFPELNGYEFETMFCREMKCEPSIMVNRIEFEHLEQAGTEREGRNHHALGVRRKND